MREKRQERCFCFLRWLIIPLALQTLQSPASDRCPNATELHPLCLFPWRPLSSTKGLVSQWPGKREHADLRSEMCCRRSPEMTSERVGIHLCSLLINDVSHAPGILSWTETGVCILFCDIKTTGSINTGKTALLCTRGLLSELCCYVGERALSLGAVPTLLRSLS